LAAVAPTAEDDLTVLGDAAAAYVEEGMRVGLGTGRAATAFIRALAARFAGGPARLSCVATSEATAKLASSLGLPLASLDAGELDLTVDGADEVDPRLDLIKGLGGALVREKIVAASSRRLLIVVGAEKLVSRLGLSTPVPVEVLPFGAALCRRRLEALGAEPKLRAAGADTFVSDNGNHILDCAFRGIEDAAVLDRAIREIPGVVGTGLFVGMAERVLVQDGRRVDVRRRTA
jgi:ribose 5-phosphate isomerase A